MDKVSSLREPLDLQITDQRTNGLFASIPPKSSELVKNDSNCNKDSLVSDTSFWEKRLETQIEHLGRISGS